MIPNPVKDVIRITNELKNESKLQLSDYEFLQIAVQIHNGTYVSTALISMVQNGTKSPFNVRVLKE